jgi:hypothetical protein
MVVDDDDRGRAVRHGALHHFADVHRRLVDGSAPHRFVGDQHVLRIEEEDAHFLHRRMGHRRLQIVLQSLPARKHGPALEPRFQQPQRRRLGDLQRGDHALAESFALERFRVGRKQRTDAAKLGDQLLRLRFRVSAGDGEREQIFDQFMVEQRLRPAFEKAPAKSGPMP